MGRFIKVKTLSVNNYLPKSKEFVDSKGNIDTEKRKPYYKRVKFIEDTIINLDAIVDVEPYSWHYDIETIENTSIEVYEIILTQGHLYVDSEGYEIIKKEIFNKESLYEKV